MEPTNFYTLPEYSSMGKAFGKCYKINDFLVLPNRPIDGRKDKIKHKTCRICKRDNTQVTFKTKAHLVPRLLGNQFGLSDFECDECNKMMCLFENDLTRYLGLTYTIHSQQDKTVKSATNDLEIRNIDILGVKAKSIKMTDDRFLPFKQSEDGITKAIFVKSSYIPNNVYKVFLKIALSSIPEEEVQNYDAAFAYLRSQNNLKGFTDFQVASVFEFDLTTNIKIPYGILFKKIKETLLVPTHMFSLYFFNKIVSIPLPFHMNDAMLEIQGRKLALLAPPPLSSSPFSKSICAEHHWEDLMPTIPRKGERQEMRIEGDKRNPELEITFDPQTGKTVKGQEKIEAVGVYFVPHGTRFPIVDD